MLGLAADKTVKQSSVDEKIRHKSEMKKEVELFLMDSVHTAFISSDVFIVILTEIMWKC